MRPRVQVGRADPNPFRTCDPRPEGHLGFTRGKLLQPPVDVE